MYTITLGEQGKRVFTIGPERVYTIEASDPENNEVSTVVVHTLFFPEKGAVGESVFFSAPLRFALKMPESLRIY